MTDEPSQNQPTGNTRAWSKNGGARKGAGRPQGIKNKVNMMTKKLEALNISPLVELITLYEQQERLVHADDRSNTPSAVHSAGLISHRGGLLRTMLPFAYSPLKEQEASKEAPKKPLTIRLTLNEEGDDD
jgi:hypothetical protein